MWKAKDIILHFPTVTRTTKHCYPGDGSTIASLHNREEFVYYFIIITQVVYLFSNLHVYILTH